MKIFSALTGIFIIGLFLFIILKLIGIFILGISAFLGILIMAIPGLLILFVAGVLLFTGFGLVISMITAVIGLFVLLATAPVSLPFLVIFLIIAYSLKRRDDHILRQSS